MLEYTLIQLLSFIRNLQKIVIKILTRIKFAKYIQKLLYPILLQKKARIKC